MTTFSPELIAGARAMYNSCTGTYGQWEREHINTQNHWCQAFAAGLQALLPVSNELVKSMGNIDLRKTGHDRNRAALTAAINYLTQRYA